MSRNSNFAKNTVILSIGSFLPKLAGFITLPILTGCLTKKEYGTYDLITIMVSLLLPAVTLQIKAAAFRFLLDIRSNKEKQKTVISNIWAVTLPASLLALLVLFFILPGASWIIKLWICGYYLFDILVNTTRQISRGIGNNLDYSVSAIISAFVKMICAVLFVLVMHMGLLGATIALCLSSLLSFIYISLRIKLFTFIDFSLVNKNTIKELIAYSWPIVPNDMSLWIMNMSDRVILTCFLGVTVNAVYAAATKIPSLINLAQSALTLAWQETASVSAKDKDSTKYYTEMFRMMHSLQAGVYSIVVAAVPLLFKILIRGDYGDAYYQIPILCYGIFFSGMAVYLGGIYVAYKKTSIIGITSICSALVNIIINLSLINFVGMYAASISTLASYMMLFIFRAIHVRKITPIQYDFRQMLIQNTFMIAECILCYQKNMVCYMINIILAVIVLVTFNSALMKAVLNKVLKIVKKK